MGGGGGVGGGGAGVEGRVFPVVLVNFHGMSMSIKAKPCGPT